MAHAASYFDPRTPDIVLKSLFLKYDKDNSGYLSKEELNSLLIDDLGLTAAQADAYSLLIDSNADSKLSFQEFAKWLRSGDRLESVSDKSRYARVQKAIEMFNKYDVDGNKSLDRKEFEKLFDDCGGKKARLADALNQLDTDDNGKISFTEFMKWLNWVPMDSFQ